MTEFSFLDESLQKKLRQAEEMVERHPDLSLTATRTFCEWLQDALADLHGIEKRQQGEPQYLFTDRLRKARIIPPHEVSLFNSIRKSANSATHSKGARALDARQKLMEAKALAFWYDQIRRDKFAALNGATDAKDFPPDTEIGAADHAGRESASIIAPTRQPVPQPAATAPKPTVEQESTRTKAQRRLAAATTKISNKATQRPPHKWHSSGFRVKRARWVLLSKHGH